MHSLRTGAGDFLRSHNSREIAAASTPGFRGHQMHGMTFTAEEFT